MWLKYPNTSLNHYCEASTLINDTLIELCNSLTKNCDVLYQNHKQLFCKRDFFFFSFGFSLSLCPDATAACNPNNTCRPSKSLSSTPSLELKPEKTEQVSIIISFQLETNYFCHYTELQKHLVFTARSNTGRPPQRALTISYPSVSVLYWSFTVLLSCVEGVNPAVEQYVQLVCYPISTPPVVLWENQ